jgi:cytochrome c biogenesis protein CcmG/thiol:disulfide interchange protein DsbE
VTDTDEAGVADGGTARGSRLVWGVIAAVLAFMVIAVIFAGRFGSDPGLSSSPLIGQPAPTDPIPLQDGTGAVSVADHLGDIVVVNFWASWCIPCRTEYPALVEAADDYADFGTTFIAVNYQDDAPRADAFIEELGRSVAMVYAIDEGSSTAFDWGVLGLPETFFVDRDGVVVGKVSGPVSYALVTRTLDQIILGEAIGDITTGDVENR